MCVDLAAQNIVQRTRQLLQLSHKLQLAQLAVEMHVSWQLQRAVTCKLRVVRLLRIWHVRLSSDTLPVQCKGCASIRRQLLA